MLTVFTLGFIAYVVNLDITVRKHFEGSRWELPARVFARPLEIYPDQHLSADQFVDELQRLGYRSVSQPREPGTYTRVGGAFVIRTRDFTFWDGEEVSRSIRLEFAGDRVLGLWRADDGNALDLLRLDPPQIGSIYPSHNEDRILVQLSDVPQLLIDTLLIVEDRGFYEHHGVSPRSILRALLANIRAGQTVQGGSTLTQQLVKNFFLSNERTITRKINEAIMALLVDWHYEKDEILEAYLNEVYLGQDSYRAIHGFGLASQFYFARPLSKLTPSQIALLVALVKGPSYYDPRRHWLRTHQRRDLVLKLLEEQQKLTPAEVEAALDTPLGVLPRRTSGITRTPAFIGLVRQQLRRDYSEQDLGSEGLNIFTTLDPVIQNQTEQAISRELDRLVSAGAKPELQSAAVVVDVDNGEVQAVVGGRDPHFAGFNRAIDAVRPVGSLIKPAVYLTALLRPEMYTPATLIDDGPLDVDLGGGRRWQPQNYDHESHGNVLLYTALTQSYNLSTARLGLELGVPAVIDTLRALGIERPLNEYPSLLLGATSMSPLDAAQMYHTIASGGFRTPLRAIRAVLTSDGQPLQRYPLSIEPAFDRVPVFQLTSILRGTAREGTAKSIYSKLPLELTVAGKTGTTDDLRDSWFVGFGENVLATVWLGLDDNQPAGLTGSSGALKVWSELMSNIEVHPLSEIPPAELEIAWIDRRNGRVSDQDCEYAVELSFVKGTVPEERSRCENELQNPQ
ncbi:penicillin-binding protein 1B [Kaarinaea lacus]